MKTLRQTLERNLYGIAAVMFLAAATLPNVLAGQVAHAAMITARSITMEQSTAGATDVEYTITFTPATTATIEAIVIDFCTNTPLLGAECDVPLGFSAFGTNVEAAPDNEEADWDAGSLSGTSGRVLFLEHGDGGQELEAAQEVVFRVSGFTNPSDPGTFFARIMTYDDAEDAGDYDSEAPNPGSALVDNGSVALSATDDVTISAAVLETLTFCVRLEEPEAACGGSTAAPALILGQGTPRSLDFTRVDTESAWFQLSSNGNGGTVVRLSGETLTSGSNTIEPAGDTATTITAGTEAFGLRLGAPVDVDDDDLGTINRVTPYNGAPGEYGFDTNPSTGTTSPYGGVIADSDGGPLSGWNVPMTFAATISPATAAGLYTTNLSLIATSVY